MGEKHIADPPSPEAARAFTHAMLEELEALRRLLEKPVFETDGRRIGVEQEMFLIDSLGRPAPVAVEVIAAANDEHLTTELALFNLEANLEPQILEAGALRRLELTLERRLSRADHAARRFGARVLLTGILPSLTAADLTARFMTPEPRYRQLDASIQALRGGSRSITIRGKDRLEVSPTSVMFEAANTSLQLHMQVAPERFAALYNLAQLLAAPLVAFGANSPTLLGRRLWSETRIALFEASVDGRSASEAARDRPSRVTFGWGWVRSALELFEDTVARYPVVITCDTEPDPVAAVEAGAVPKLQALMLHNGTVWRWNRACFGVMDDRPHLRVEARVLPAGPTIRDEVANAALHFGLMHAMLGEADAIPDRVDFSDARLNLMRAARDGMAASFRWLDGEEHGARQLLLEELIPRARAGLEDLGVEAEEISSYLGLAEERAASGRNGAVWIDEAVGKLQAGPKRDGWHRRLSLELLAGQDSRRPVHAWRPLEVDDDDDLPPTVADVMSTDLYTVGPEDAAELALQLMDWRHLHHVPVEAPNDQGLGLISQRSVLRWARQLVTERDAPVRELMTTEVDVIAPDLPLTEAVERLLSNPHGCLLVQQDGALIGIVTQHDVLRIAWRMIERQQRSAPGDTSPDEGASADDGEGSDGDR